MWNEMNDGRRSDDGMTKIRRRRQGKRRNNQLQPEEKIYKKYIGITVLALMMMVLVLVGDFFIFYS